MLCALSTLVNLAGIPVLGVMAKTQLQVVGTNAEYTWDGLHCLLILRDFTAGLVCSKLPCVNGQRAAIMLKETTHCSCWIIFGCLYACELRSMLLGKCRNNTLMC